MDLISVKLMFGMHSSFKTQGMNFRHADEAQDEGWTPSGCYNLREYVRPLTVFPRR